MERGTVLQWLALHPGIVHGDPEEIVSRCERAVRRHAAEMMWLAAKAYAEKRRHIWEHQVGQHASEAYTARDVCHEIARGLRRQEPGFDPADADRLAGAPVKNQVDAEAWRFLLPWILDLAREQGHEVWEEIVRYTNRHARDLIRQHHLSDDCSLNRSRCYGKIAAEIAGMLEHDYAVHAFPH